MPRLYISAAMGYRLMTRPKRQTGDLDAFIGDFGARDIFVPANFEQLIHDLLERFRPDMPPKHIGYLARRSLR